MVFSRDLTGNYHFISLPSGIYRLEIATTTEKLLAEVSVNWHVFTVADPVLTFAESLAKKNLSIPVTFPLPSP